MCGIAGIVNADSDRVVDRAIIQEMCNEIHHRGPDDMGLWCGPGAGIGMTRLAIIDVSSGAQPMFNEDDTVGVVFNGEIYNHEALRTLLEAKGHRFRTHADTETIIHLYEQFGRDCVEHLRGMFTFAIWDSVNERLFMARDRLGIKPLHYCIDGGRMIFGSEIKSILAAPNVPRAMSPDALVGYTAYGYVPAPLTMFEGIHKLEAGHWLEYHHGEVTIEQYWDVAYHPAHERSEEQTIDEVMHILDDAVRMRLMSEVPLGAFLSGGTDSSVVVGLMSRHSVEPVKTFSIGFDYAEYNELKYARPVAAHFGTEHRDQIVRPNVLDVLGSLVDQFDEPFSDSSAIPTYYLSKMTREHVTVALSGDGGDELFAGYHRFFDRPHERAAARVPVALRNTILGPLTKVLPAGTRGIDYMRDTIGSPDDQYIRRISSGVSGAFGEIFTGGFAQTVSSVNPSRLAHNYFARVKDRDVLSRRQYLDTKMFMCDDILTKVDRMSMLVSLETRVPILDHKLVEYAATIPPAMHTRGSGMKHILKKVAERLMPAAMVDRPKMGFGIPLGDWIRKDWAPMAEDLVLGERAMSRGNFEPGFLRRVMDEHRRGRRDHGTMIWRLMVLELWWRRRLEGESHALADTYPIAS